MHQGIDLRQHTPRFDAALAFAARMHDGQKRKGTDIPYIVHPVAVATLLAAHGMGEDVVIAGLLHDVLEDTACDESTLARRFGARVAACVVAVSEADKSLPWETRKAAMHERLRGASEDAKCVAAADKAHNLHTIADALEAGDTEIWQRFRRGRDAQLENFRAGLAAIAAGFEHPLVEELRRALGRVEQAAGT